MMLISLGMKAFSLRGDRNTKTKKLNENCYRIALGKPAWICHLVFTSEVCVFQLCPVGRAKCKGVQDTRRAPPDCGLQTTSANGTGGPSKVAEYRAEASYGWGEKQERRKPLYRSLKNQKERNGWRKPGTSVAPESRERPKTAPWLEGRPLASVEDVSVQNG